jgi:Ca2+-binding RTX toxin-like protein
LFKLRSEIICQHLQAVIFLLVVMLSWPTIAKDIFAADVIGNDFDNSFYGSMSDDIIEGKGGNDNLFGITGDDDISGGSGNDFIQGDSGDDNLKGDGDNDLVQGGAGNDTINGGSGNDTLIASFVTGSTTLRDFAPDNIICGDGNDTAFINLADNDTASLDCEIIVDTPGPPNENESELVDEQLLDSSVNNETELLPLT